MSRSKDAKAFVDSSLFVSYPLPVVSLSPFQMSRRENAVDLAKFVDKGVRVKLSGGREGKRERERERREMKEESGLHRRAPDKQRPEKKTPVRRLSTLFLNTVRSPLPLSSSSSHKKPKKQNETVEGVLKGYDQLLNLVLDEAIEYHRSAEDILTVTDETRPLGLVVCRGTAVMAVAPTAGAEVMASNPFLSATSAGETEAEGGAGAAAAEEAATA